MSEEESALRLLGQTSDGRLLESDGVLRRIAINEQNLTLGARTITIQDAESSADKHQFLLTNVDFPDVSAGRMPSPVSLTIPTPPVSTNIALEPHAEHMTRKTLLRRHKLPTPSALLTVNSGGTVDYVAEFADQLCRALSIVQGHKISWVTQEALGADGRSLCKRYQNRVTKRASNLPLNRIGGNQRLLPLDAAAECFEKIGELQERYGWNGPVLEGWLEARTDVDFLESRALKFVTVIEALRTVVLQNEPGGSHLSPSAWKAFLEYIIPVARFFLAAGLRLNKEQIAAMTLPTRWESLNRKSFRSQITATLRKLGVDERPRTIDLFVKSRNKLIHEGVFQCKSALAAQAEADVPRDPNSEYFFIAGFVDRVILQAVGLNKYLRSQGP